MNAAKAASRMRSRTAASSPPAWRSFDIDVLAISLSLTTLVPYSTITDVWYPLVPHQFRRDSKELHHEHRNVFPTAGVRHGPGAHGARPVDAASAQDHRRADDP